MCLSSLRCVQTREATPPPASSAPFCGPRPAEPGPSMLTYRNPPLLQSLDLRNSKRDRDRERGDRDSGRESVCVRVCVCVLKEHEPWRTLTHAHPAPTITSGLTTPFFTSILLGPLCLEASCTFHLGEPPSLQTHPHQICPSPTC